MFLSPAEGRSLYTEWPRAREQQSFVTSIGLWGQTGLPRYPSQVLWPCSCPTPRPALPHSPCVQFFDKCSQCHPSLGWPDLPNKNTEHLGKLKLQINDLSSISFLTSKKLYLTFKFNRGFLYFAWQPYASLSSLLLSILPQERLQPSLSDLRVWPLPLRPFPHRILPPKTRRLQTEDL